MTILNLGILGCGDFLRGNLKALKSSTLVKVAKVFDPDRQRAAAMAAELGAVAVASEAEILGARDIQVAALFSPPFLHAPQIEAAAQAGQHILTTKPLAPDAAACARAVAAVERAGVRCGVIYRRTGTPQIAAIKRLVDGGSIGRLALYRQDWIHHYPTWNAWATDPAKNGGPFMDAMVHNLNIARHLMGRPSTHCTYFSDNLAHPQLKCRDTECMKLDFAGGTAHLFITWAADLRVMSHDGNNREHIDHCYLVTDQGWYITFGWGKDGPEVTAKREDEVRTVLAPSPAQSVFDRFAAAIAGTAGMPEELPTIQEAAADICLMRAAERQLGQRFATDATMGG
jgi:predicted dehydrogenase